ncbi:MAG: peptidase M3, partial [Alistipes sp.]|nr:peptidase M3 [Alistipes sp.]
VIPKSLQEKMRRSSLFNQGFATTELVAAALIDLDIHTLTSLESPLDVNGFEKQMLVEKRGLIPQIEPRYRYTYFRHIFDGGYSAGYYFYLWAELLDKDAFDAFKQSPDLFDQELARKFRYEVLARGGEADGMTLYRNFRGAEPSKIPMLKGRGLWVAPEVEAEPEPVKEMPEPDDLR